MLVFALSGSLRTGSYNTALLRAAAAAAPAGVVVEPYDGLAALPHFDEDREGTVPCAVRELRERVGAADVLLFATPEYNGSVPGHLKTAVDWVSRPYGASALWAKPAAVIGATTGSFGGVRAQDELRKVLRTGGARVLDVTLAVPRVHEQLDEAGRPRPALRRRLDELLATLAAEAGGMSAAA